jgi:hypothetical protein
VIEIDERCMRIRQQFSGDPIIRFSESEARVKHTDGRWLQTRINLRE